MAAPKLVRVSMPAEPCAEHVVHVLKSEVRDNFGHEHFMPVKLPPLTSPAKAAVPLGATANDMKPPRRLA